MNTVAATDWIELNQRHLSAALGEVRSLLERHMGQEATSPDPEPPPPAGPPFALDQVQEGFGLTDFERFVLLLSAGPELDGSFASLCADAQGSEGRPFPTFSLALAAFPGAHWSAITPGAPLRRWGLVDLGSGQVTAAALSIDEQVLHCLTGAEQHAAGLAGILDPAPARGDLPPSQADVAQRLAALLTVAAPDGPVPQLVTGSTCSAEDVAAEAAAHAGMWLSALDARLIPTEARAISDLVRLLEREAVLSGTAFLVDPRGAEEPDRLATVRLLLERLRAPAVLAVRERLDLGRRATVVLDLSRPTASEQRILWSSGGHDAEAQRLAAQFDLDSQTIRAVTASASDAWNATRALTRPKLGALAQRIDGDFSWDQLILPAHQRGLLDQIALHVRHRLTVHETWGFGRGSRRGSGTAALFSGPSGTGKTLAAQVLASELRLDLFRVDLSSVLSKYIGETEKNLRSVFDAADEGAVVLLFDEADALFGRRSEVKDSHDRYANLEISYLLQRIEEQRGLVLLTTNMRESIDPAFVRRLRFMVEFPFPDRASRAEMWRRVFPSQAPTGCIDAEALSLLNLSGAAIRSIAIAAAVLAADEGVAIDMEHLARAARTECAKVDQPFPGALR